MTKAREGELSRAADCRARRLFLGTDDSILSCAEHDRMIAILIVQPCENALVLRALAGAVSVRVCSSVHELDLVATNPEIRGVSCDTCDSRGAETLPVIKKLQRRPNAPIVLVSTDLTQRGAKYAR